MRNKISENIYSYLNWPIILSVVLTIASIIIYKIKSDIAILVIIIILMVIAISIFIYIKFKNKLLISIEDFASDQSNVIKEVIMKSSIPVAICCKNGTIVWANSSFLGLGEKIAVGNSITSYFTEVSRDILFNISNEKINILSSFGDRKFSIHINKLGYNDMLANVKNKEHNEFLFLYFEEKTDYYKLRQKNDDEQIAVGLIYIDNYDEITEKVKIDDTKSYMYSVFVDRKLTKYISNTSGIIKKLEKDKYFFITSKKMIQELMKNRFSILEEVKQIIGDNNIPLTLSIGVGYGGKSLETNYDLAGSAIDLALGRGGDQAVVKEGKEVKFFGGKSSADDSNARVRARVKASTFKEILDTKDKVFIMGHTKGDLDSFGASIATYVMAKFSEKNVYIIQNSITSQVKELRDKFVESKMYPQDMFLSGDEAIKLVDSNSLLIIVDHNVDSISDDKRFLELGISTVIFDHHRLQKNTISNVLMEYIEPNASSASEMVAELIKFYDDNLKLKPLEAESILSGIMLDTQNFIYHTSSKTFEAASFLKKFGADINKVRKLMRSDRITEKLKNDAINRVEYYKDVFAITTVTDNNINELSVLASQVANELINIKDIKASMVVYPAKSGFTISSRSIDEINVQVLMEKLGGGGHISQAGANVEAENIEEAISELKKAIDEMILEKEVK